MSSISRRPLAISFLFVTSVILVPAVTCDLFPQPVEPTLEGSWSGTITANALKAVSTTGPADIDDPQATPSTAEFPFLVTFAADGTPDKLLVIVPPIGSSGMELLGVTVFQPDESVKVDTSGRQLTVTVRESSYTPTSMRVVLDTSMTWTSFSGHNTGTFEQTGTSTGTQTIEARPNTDGTGVLWTQTVDGTAHINTTHHSTIDGSITTGESWEAHRVDATGQSIPHPTLEGSWTATVNATALRATSTTGPVDINQAATTSSTAQFPLSVTFAADGTPDKLLFIAPPVSYASLESAEIPALQSGETTNVALQDRAYVVTAREVSYTPVKMRVVLDTSMAYETVLVQHTTWSEITGTGTGVQTIEIDRSDAAMTPTWTQIVDSSAAIETVHHVRFSDDTVTNHSWEAARVEGIGPLGPQ